MPEQDGTERNGSGVERSASDGRGARHLVLILGDQLHFNNPVLNDFDPAQDRVLMIEAASESTVVWSSKPRIALFLSAMRHFALELEERGWPLSYLHLDDALADDFAAHLAAMLQRYSPRALIVCEPGEWRLLALIQDVCARHKCLLDVRPDPHFICSIADFRAWAGDKKELRQEFFYRWLRRREGILLDADGAPEGGAWNYDADNRKAYPRSGPGLIPPPTRFEPDAITRRVFALIEEKFPEHPGGLDHFIWPVTRAQALQALDCFIEERLEHFGPHQDAMWTDTPYGWHALLSSSLNLHLLDPREVIDAAIVAYRTRSLPLGSVEGFVRQVLGWREFIRGVYWLAMPGLKEANHYQHQRALPAWYWTGQTQMNCMRASITQTLEHGFAHHIQRLMVTGQFALLAEIEPQQVADWYLAVYVDAVEWVELPNVAGMALYANGGHFTSKPYIASGAYIKRMSNYCDGCRYDPALRAGEKNGKRACPVTTLYWNFLDRHEPELLAQPRTSLMAKNVARLGANERKQIRIEATHLLNNLGAL